MQRVTNRQIAIKIPRRLISEKSKECNRCSNSIRYSQLSFMMLSEINDIIAVHRAILAALNKEAQQHIIKNHFNNTHFTKALGKTHEMISNFHSCKFRMKHFTLNEINIARFMAYQAC